MATLDYSNVSLNLLQRAFAGDMEAREQVFKNGQRVWVRYVPKFLSAQSILERDELFSVAFIETMTLVEQVCNGTVALHHFYFRLKRRTLSAFWRLARMDYVASISQQGRYDDKSDECQAAVRAVRNAAFSFSHDMWDGGPPADEYWSDGFERPTEDVALDSVWRRQVGIALRRALSSVGVTYDRMVAIWQDASGERHQGWGAGLRQDKRALVARELPDDLLPADDGDHHIRQSVRNGWRVEIVLDGKPISEYYPSYTDARRRRDALLTGESRIGG